MTGFDQAFARNQSDQKLCPAFLAKHRDRHGPERRRPHHASRTQLNAACGQSRAHERLHLTLAAELKTLANVTAQQALSRIFEQGLRAHIGLQHALVVGIDHQHRLRGGVKQHAVARLDVAQTQVVALHGLLGFHQTALQLSQTFQIATHGEQFPARQRQHHVLQGHFIAHGRRVVDVSPTHGFGRPLRVQHVLNFDAALGRHGVQPWTPNPSLTAQGAQTVSSD